MKNSKIYTIATAVAAGISIASKLVFGVDFSTIEFLLSFILYATLFGNMLVIMTLEENNEK